jgi:hypothetical protein
MIFLRLPLRSVEPNEIILPPSPHRPSFHRAEETQLAGRAEAL